MRIGQWVVWVGLFWVHGLHAETCVVPLGDSTVTIERIANGSGKTFVHVHQNEVTAKQAALRVIKANGGSLLTLHHEGGGRNIVFHVRSVRYEFDPNRIYTERGISKTLNMYSQDTPQAHAAVRRLAERIKAWLPEGKIIAVHNNSRYSWRDYCPGHPLASNLRLMSRPHADSMTNFYLVTQEQDYRRLKHLPVNSILQVRHPVDDGSLSVYLASRRYVNVEAGFDQLAEQIKLLQEV